ncbi:MAG: peptide chain release factor N(5)-glutamine methyltransferase [Flavobacteriaceae bacterium]|nr:peptide chain release factor N(5)-glutamine methyltransferase [Eudoraea sp.]MBT8311975.1 peptide chain release factor N(5)-glutamine methyltransferase [Eudoraea sp.]NNJ38381.1 peptide chain release factor N(5)-glutamine methyltransferase [Flavobacteriaceae bacterium]NNJ40941.1 peptide chain release factor N(5)-glutamine methyltransferase [Eudoraea sp.]
MLLREIRNIYQQELAPFYPKSEIDSILDILLEYYLDIGRFVLALQPDYNLKKEEEQPLFEALTRLQQEEPVQYITEEAHFFGMDFRVSPKVLIPRPETEDLIRWILETIGDHSQALNILDVGTGSGNIAISLAKHLPNAKIYALDISPEALEIAQNNALANKVEVLFIQADIRTTERLQPKFDLIVSNPPYVRLSERKEMRGNVKHYEPSQALFVPDDAPLLFYEILTKYGKANFQAGGMLFLEINQYLGKEVLELLRQQGYQKVELKKDLFGRDRMVKGVFIGEKL